MPVIQSYLYADLASCTTLQLSEDGGAHWYTMTLSATSTVTDALDDWAAQANAHGSLSGTYQFGWSTYAHAVIMYGSVTWSVIFDHSLATALGFANSTYNDISGTLTGDATAAAICDALGVDYDVPEMDEEVDLRVLRWGRALGLVHWRHETQRFRVMFDTATAQTVMAGSLLAGKLRLNSPDLLTADSTYWTADTTLITADHSATTYGLSCSTGCYHEVYPFEVESSETMGVADGHTLVTFRGVVA